jgi:hypothetical protein
MRLRGGEVGRVAQVGWEYSPGAEELDAIEVTKIYYTLALKKVKAAIKSQYSCITDKISKKFSYLCTTII